MKFRILSTEDKKLYTNVRIEDDIYIDNDTGETIEGTIQLATGVKDIYGRMIYEGDVIHVRDQIAGIIASNKPVFFQENKGCFSVLIMGTLAELIDRNFLFEIVGNVGE